MLYLLALNGFLAYYVSDLILFVLGNGSPFSYDAEVVDKFSLFGQYLTFIEDKNMQFIFKVVQFVRGEYLQKSNILMKYLKKLFLFGLLRVFPLIFGLDGR